jgi:hypothetical protein
MLLRLHDSRFACGVRAHEPYNLGTCDAPALL